MWQLNYPSLPLSLSNHLHLEQTATSLPPSYLRTVGPRVHRVSVVVAGIGLVDPAPGSRGAGGHAGRSSSGRGGRGCRPLLLLLLLQGRPLLLQLLLLGSSKHLLLLLPGRKRGGIDRLGHRHVHLLLLRTGRRGNRSGGDDDGRLLRTHGGGSGGNHGRLLRTSRRGVPQGSSGCE